METRTCRNAPSKPNKIYRWKKRRHGRGYRRIFTGKVATPANQSKPVELSSLKPALNYWNDCPLCHSPDNKKAVITQVMTDRGFRKVATCRKCKQQFLAYHQ